MSFDGDKIYVGNTDSVRRYSFNSTLEGKGEKILDLPGESGHITRNVLVSNKTIYVSIGSSENVVDEGPPRASVQVCNLDGTGNRTFAFGLRNPNGLEFHPITQKLYTTVNERYN